MARQSFIKRTNGGNLSLDSTPFARLLDLCIKYRSARAARLVHAHVIKSPFCSEVFILNRLIDAYGRCGCLGDAQKLFNRMKERNIFTWNSLIGILLKSGFLVEGESLFKSMPEPDQCSWNSMVAGLAQHGRLEKAQKYFVMMHREDFVLNEYSFGSGLSVCARLRDMKMGTQIHASIVKSRYSMNVYMGSALIDMYSKCGLVDCAEQVFDGMNEINLVSWNSLISCYEQNGPVDGALELFVRMMKLGFQPDEVTLASVVSACASMAAIRQGLEIHGHVVKSDKLRNDLFLGNALVDMYAKCGRIAEARCIFDRMPTRSFVSETCMISGYAKMDGLNAARLMFSKMVEKNIVSWNALIAGYTHIGENEEAISLFCMLKKESICPTDYTFGNLLNACANLADLQLGRQAHTHVLKHGLHFQSGEEPDTFVGNSLIDMYMKCGSVEDGSRVFENLVDRNLISWNAMIVGCAQNGYGTEALGLFSKMLASGWEPDHITLIGALCACSHAGLVDEGRYFFYSMTERHGLVPTNDHYACMVDLLGRAGCLDEAKDLIDKMPMQPDSIVWGSLLAACRVHRNITLGNYAANKLLEIETGSSGPYVLLSNMYAELGKWRKAVGLRKLMRHRGIIKQPGCSWIKLQGSVHVFMVKDKGHLKNVKLCSLLNMLVKQMKQARCIQNPDDVDDAYGGSFELEPWYICVM